MKYLQLIFLSLCLFLASSIATPNEGYGQRFRGFKPKKKTSSFYRTPKASTGKVIKPKQVPKIPKSTPTPKDKVRDISANNGPEKNVGPTTTKVRKPIVKVKRATSQKAPQKFVQLPSKGKINPSEIRFSQNSVKSKLSDGTNISSLTEKIKSGKVKPEDIPPIRIVHKDGLIYSLDNRRLKAFKDAGVPIHYKKLDAIPKDELSKFTTKNNGTSIIIRSDEFTPASR